MSKAILDICKHVAAQAARRTRLPPLEKGIETLLSDDTDGTQIWLHVGPDKASIQVILPHLKRFGTMWWITETGTGKFSPSGSQLRAPLPRGLQERLRRARPLPGEGMYAYWSSRRVIVLYQVVIESHDDARLRIVQFVRQGVQPPIEPVGQGHYWRAADWWAAVDRGALKPAEELFAKAKRPVLWGTRHDMDWYILASEPWTGAGARRPQLYVEPGVRGRITLEQAIDRGGMDIRDRFQES